MAYISKQSRLFRSYHPETGQCGEYIGRYDTSFMSNDYDDVSRGIQFLKNCHYFFTGVAV